MLQIWFLLIFARAKKLHKPRTGYNKNRLNFMKDFCNSTQGLLYWWSHPCLTLHAETLVVRKGTGWEWTGRMVLLTSKILKGFSYEIKRKPDKWPSSIYLTPYLSALLTFSCLKYVSSLINLIFSLFSKCIFILKV